MMPWTLDNPLQAVLLGAVLALAAFAVILYLSEMWG